jgi:hypothetical protein
MQTRLKFRVVITVFLLAVLALSTITTVVRILVCSIIILDTPDSGNAA